MCRPATATSPGRRCPGANEKTNIRRRAQRAEAKAKKLAEQSGETITTTAVPEQVAIKKAPAVKKNKVAVAEAEAVANKAAAAEAEAARAASVEAEKDRLDAIVAKPPTFWNQPEFWDVAGNPVTRPETLTRLAAFDDRGCRMKVAGNPSTPVEVLSKLSRDRNVDVKRSAADNPNTPVEDLVRLSQAKNRDVQQAALRNPSMAAKTAVTA